MDNLLRIPGRLPEGDELVEVLAGGAGVRIERIVSTGQATPPGAWYDQPADEWVALLEGRATLRFEDGGTVALGRGDWLLIPARRRHRVEATSADPPCVWVAVHFPPPGRAERA
jgi:cupin 2 domain-containing protein